jgi:pimeloyl-ACP methyl ester carboxylesterase
MSRSILLYVALAAGTVPTRFAPPGRLVDLGGHRLHVHCSGAGHPVAVIENGFDEFSSDWSLVQTRLSRITRTCTYDRAGYAWSDPGPKPRTFDQINMELREALLRLGEQGPFLLVGHSFGGPVVRRFAETYPGDVAGLALVDSVQEDQRVPIQGKAVRLRDSAQGRMIPAPHLAMTAADRPPVAGAAEAAGRLEPPLDRLSAEDRQRHAWAQSQPSLQDAEDSERTWSPEYLARWAKSSQEGSLGEMPLVVLTRARGGYGDDLDIPGAQLDGERKRLQERLAGLSRKGRQVLVDAGHDMHLEAPEVVAGAIADVVDQVRHRSRGSNRRKARANAGG